MTIYKPQLINITTVIIRLPFIAAQEDMFPKFVALIQVKNGTPIVGLFTMVTSN